MSARPNATQPSKKSSKKSSAGGLLALFGFILVAQGFGSAITESGWDTSFGVSALLREANAPEWTDLLVGAFGCALLALAARRRFTRDAP